MRSPCGELTATARFRGRSLSDELRLALLEERAHPLGAVLRVEQQRERLCLLAIRCAQRHVVAAFDEALRARHGERSPRRDLPADLAAVRQQLLAREDRVNESDLRRLL